MAQAIITTSWDDGHPLDERIAAMLSKYKLTGTFYVPRTISTGVMPDAQLRDLSSRFEIGAHTLNHVFLADADDATARMEIEGSKKWVEDQTGKACTMFCPPAGRFKPQHRPMFSAAGYEGIRTVEFLSLDHPRRVDNLNEMPTTLQAFRQPLKAYVRNALKRKAWGNLWTLMIRGRSSHWTVLAKRLSDHALRTGGVFHLWGHSWEIESAGLWGELDGVLKRLGEVVASGRATCMTNGELCRPI